ncbi:MAG: hypothetical protein Kow0029_12040 [Candidatus Rifleibacteriota bacterium]
MLSAEEKQFPPFYVYKIADNDKLVPFEINDLHGRSWSNKSFLSRPMIFITGNWKLRHDIRKWADYLSLNFNNTVDVLWLFNPSGTEFADHQNRIESAFAKIRPPVPVLVDYHSLIGRSLQICYQIPTVIGLTRKNRLAFVVASPLNEAAKTQINALINNKLFK